MRNITGSRRTFLAAMSASSYQRVLGANERIRIGFVGYGLIGKQHVGDFRKMPDVDCTALCEVCRPRLDEGLAHCGPGAKGYADFRKMYEDKNLDAVVISTPDHWHALQTILACAAGKDVYVEKPLTLFVREGRWMVTAVRRYRRMVVVGTQRRHGAAVRAAREYVAGGTLGRIHTVRAASCRNVYPGFGKTAVAEPPPGLDYDLWLGPAPEKPYTAHRSLYHFRWFWDYSGGQMTNLGAHALDLIHAIMSVNAPTQVFSNGGRVCLEDDGETPDLQDALFTYPGFTCLYTIREANARSDLRGITFYGTKGSLVLGRGVEVIPEMRGDPLNQIPRFLGHPPGGVTYSDTKPEPYMQPAKSAEPSGDTLMLNKRDWLNSIRSRKLPVCDVEEGHRVATATHLANISMRLGRSLRWDPQNEDILGDRKASALLERPYRGPWDEVLRSLKL